MSRFLRRALAPVATVALVAWAAAAGAVNCPGPDAFGHTCTPDPPGAGFVGPTSSGNLVVCDDCCTIRSIGFTYMHYGTPYTSTGVTANGFLTLGGSCESFAGACPVPNATNPAGMVGAFYDYFPAGNGFVRDGVVGVAPNRIYFVEFSNVPYCCTSAPPYNTFQIQLWENGGAGEKARVVFNDGQTFDVSQQNAAKTDGLTFSCGFIGASFSVEFSTGAPPVSADCDLAPIEAKLDTDTRWVDEDELGTALAPVANGISTLEAKLDVDARWVDEGELAASQAAQDIAFASLETKLDTDSLWVDEAELAASLSPVMPGIASLETKLDTDIRWVDEAELATALSPVMPGIASLETKLDTDIRWVDEAELAASQGAIVTEIDQNEIKLDAIEAKLDASSDNEEMVRIEIEKALLHTDRISHFYLPLAFAGRLETVRAITADVIAQNTAAGIPVGTAADDLAAGDADMSAGRWKAAFDHYRKAYRTVVTGR